MSIQRYGSPQRGGLPFSRAAGADGWLYVSGQVPRDSDGEMVAGTMGKQALVTLNNLQQVLESAGYTLDQVVRVGVWLDDPRDFAEFNRVYAKFFSTEHAPARVTVQARMMSDLKVEVDCIAYRQPGKQAERQATS
ncbi:RidA family protein [Desulfogranum mediterraneum]|uniref:RidA family protein n=1 Tax=Desulfogranum mediterraneum TaxID=160661 RepID=UPI0003FE80DF|nr:RidA family protein [Desulfogranum mediterraneum]